MKLLKRDLFAAFLSYVLLHITILYPHKDDLEEDSSNNINLSIDLSFFSEYTHIIKSKRRSTNSLMKKGENVKDEETYQYHTSSKPLLLMDENIMIVPIRQHEEQQQKQFTELQILDISTWRKMKHDADLALPFYAKKISSLPMPNNTLVNDGSLAPSVVRKLAASPLQYNNNNSGWYRDIVSIWDNKHIMVHRIDLSSLTDHNPHKKFPTPKLLWDDDSILSLNSKHEVSFSKHNFVEIREIDAIFHIEQQNKDKTKTKSDKNDSPLPDYDDNEYTILIRAKVFHKVLPDNDEENKVEKEHHDHHQHSEHAHEHNILVKLDGNTGSILWKNEDYHDNNNKHEHEQTTTHKKNRNPFHHSDDCIHHFRSSLFDPSNQIFPHAFWGSTSSSHSTVDKDDDSFLLQLVKFERKRQLHQNQHQKSFPFLSFPSKSAITVLSSMSNTVNSSPAKNSGGTQQEETQSQQSTSSATYTRRKNNVVLSHDQNGIKAFSLKNGHEVCHISLLGTGHLYTDLDNDGNLDQIHVPAIGHHEDHKHHVPLKIFESLHMADIVVDDSQQDTEEGGEQLLEEEEEEHYSDHSSCVIAAYSGIPAHEKLIQYPHLCSDDSTTRNTNNKKGMYSFENKKNKISANTPSSSLSSSRVYSSAVPLILKHNHNKRVSSSSSSTSTSNIIVALHTGNVIMFQVKSSTMNNSNNNNKEANSLTSSSQHSTLVWKTKSTQNYPLLSDESSKSNNKIPTWTPNEQGQTIASVQTLPSSHGKAFVISGEDGMAVLSTATGKIVSSIEYPQRSIAKPMLVHIESNKGVQEKDILLVMTMDAIWGYTITTKIGGTTGFWKIVVSLLFFFIFVVILRQYFAMEKKKKSRYYSKKHNSTLNNNYIKRCIHHFNSWPHSSVAFVLDKDKKYEGR